MGKEARTSENSVHKLEGCMGWRGGGGDIRAMGGVVRSLE
jgi:hypothetical protein